MHSNDSLDERIADVVSRLGQRMSRRGVLAKVGTWAFKIAGLSLIPVVLPVDRAYAQFNCSGDWQTCGMHGFFCKTCCGESQPRYATCPSCTFKRACWPACCTYDGCHGVTIQYCDCCGGTAPSGSCTGSICGLGGACPPNWPNYCNLGEQFHCTIIVNTNTSCTNIQNRC